MYENGRLHCIIPSGGWGSDIVDWTCSVTLIPWAIYEFYGDQTCLRDNYTEMKRHTDYWLSKFPDGLVGDAGLGDWVPPQSCSQPRIIGLYLPLQKRRYHVTHSEAIRL